MISTTRWQRVLFVAVLLSCLSALEACGSKQAASNTGTMSVTRSACVGPRVRVAVLPITPKSETGENKLGYAIADELLYGMTSDCGIDTVSTDYTYYLEPTAQGGDETAVPALPTLTALGAMAVVFGNYSFDSNKLEIQISIYDIQKGAKLGDVSVAGHVSQLNYLLHKIATDTLNLINSSFGLPPSKRAQIIPPVRSFDSFSAYAKCRFEIVRCEYHYATSDCSRSAELDPDFWQAKVFLSLAYIESSEPMKTKQWLSDGIRGARDAKTYYLLGLAHRLQSHLSFSERSIADNSGYLENAIEAYSQSGLQNSTLESLVDLADHYARIANLVSADESKKKAWRLSGEQAIASAEQLLSAIPHPVAKAELYEAKAKIAQKEIEKKELLKTAVSFAKEAIGMGLKKGRAPMVLVRAQLDLAELELSLKEITNGCASLAEAENYINSYEIPASRELNAKNKLSPLKEKCAGQ